MAGTLANVQIAYSAPNLSVYNAGTTTLSANKAAIINTASLITSDDLTLNMLAVTYAAATVGEKVFCVLAEDIPAGRVGRAWGPGCIAEAIAESTVTANTYVGSSTVTAGSLATATAVNAYAGLALATVATTEHFPVLLIPGTSV